MALTLLGAPGTAQAWFDNTHAAVLRAADRAGEACSAVAPDAMATKLPREKYNHWHNLPVGAEVTAELVLAQVERVDTEDPVGHLYGAALVAFRQLRQAFVSGRPRSYWVGFLGHYLADLAQPLHNVPYDAYNAAHHRRIDGLVDGLPDLAGHIRAHAPGLHLADEAALIAAIVALATQARAEAARLVAGEPWPAERALALLGQAAALLRAAIVLAQPPASGRPAPP